MDSSGKINCYSTIFDYYYKTEENIHDFSWEQPPPNLKLKISDIVAEGKLYANLYNSKPYYHVATSNMLIRFTNEEDPKPEAVLYLRFPILLPIRSNEIYGFSLNAHNKIISFYTDSPNDVYEWYCKLKRFSNVLLSNLYDYFELGPLIGNGTYAKVHLGLNKDSQTKYAIKMISRNTLLSNKKALVYNKYIPLFSKYIERNDERNINFKKY